MKNLLKQTVMGLVLSFCVVSQAIGPVMAQSTLLPNAAQQYFNNNGVPLARRGT